MRRVVVPLALLMTAGCGPSAFTDLDRDPGSGGSGGHGAPDGGAGGNTGGGGGTSCEDTVALAVEVETFPPDLLLVIDRSSTMSQTVDGAFTMKWDVMRASLSSVIGTWKQHIHYGLMLFPPPGQTCSAGVVDIAPGATTAAAIDSTLDATFPGGGTPASGSLQNALAHFAAAPVNPHGRYVLLATDGLPTCEFDPVPRTIDAIAALRDAGVETFVLGFDAQGDAAALDAMAAAGGTGSHYAAHSPSQLSTALAAVTSELVTISCSYQLQGAPEDWEVLDVTIDGVPIARDPAHQSGWDYDPASETLSFYGGACDQLRASGGAAVVSVGYCHSVD